METKPSFYKILMGIPPVLRIPEGFMEKYGNIFPREVVLRNSLGATWEVLFENVEDGHHGFTRGWPEFCRDMGLKFFELLIFSFAGDATFDVSVYAVTALEKVASAQVFQNPRCNITLRDYHYHKLHVPCHFVAAADLKGKNKVALQYCAHGLTREVNLNLHKRRVSFGSGWAQFWQANKLTVNVGHTFEFIPLENVIRVWPHPDYR